MASAGIMDHEEARRKNVGGKVLGFFLLGLISRVISKFLIERNFWVYFQLG